MAGGIPEREYVWLPPDGQRWGLPLAMISDAGTPGPRIHYLHTDHLGTPVAMASGGLAQVEWRASYRPFGEVHAITGTQDLALRSPASSSTPRPTFTRTGIATTIPAWGGICKAIQRGYLLG